MITVWHTVPPTVPEYMEKVCQGKKRCLALVFMEEDDDPAKLIYEPSVHLKYSQPVIWVLVKKVQDGFIISLNCKNSTRTSWMLYNKQYLHKDRKYPKRKIDREIFLHCIKPKPGDQITAAFFHLPPLVNLDKRTGVKVSCRVRGVNYSLQ